MEWTATAVAMHDEEAEAHGAESGGRWDGARGAVDEAKAGKGGSPSCGPKTKVAVV